jgi:hypothetical protein
MTTTASLNPQILGQAENAHRALLEKVLVGTGVDYPGWVALKLTAVGPAATLEQLAARVAAATKLPAFRVAVAYDTLVSAGLIEVREGTLALTPFGSALHDKVSADIAGVLGRVYGQVSAEELAVTGRVLGAITAGVNAALAAS